MQIDGVANDPEVGAGTIVGRFLEGRGIAFDVAQHLAHLDRNVLVEVAVVEARLRRFAELRLAGVGSEIGAALVGECRNRGGQVGEPVDVGGAALPEFIRQAAGLLPVRDHDARSVGLCGVGQGAIDRDLHGLDKEIVQIVGGRVTGFAECHQPVVERVALLELVAFIILRVDVVRHFLEDGNAVLDRGVGIGHRLRQALLQVGAEGGRDRRQLIEGPDRIVQRQNTRPAVAP